MLQNENQKEKRNFQNTKEDIKKLLEFFNKEKKDSKDIFMYTSFKNFKNNNPNKLKVKTTFVNPSDIIEEVKQKFEFKTRIKKLENKEDSCQSYIHGNYDRDKKVYLSNILRGKTKSVDKSSNDPNAKFTRNKSNSKIFRNGAVDVEKEKMLSTCINFPNSFNKSLHLPSTEKKSKTELKINEMSYLISNHSKSHIKPNEIFFLSNVIEKFSKNFPDKFRDVRNYFKHDTSLINSENKEIQMFLVILDIIISSSLEVKHDTNSNIVTETNKKLLEIFDSFFLDFCNHISYNSIHVRIFIFNVSEASF